MSHIGEDGIDWEHEAELLNIVINGRNARIAELEAERDRLAAIVERARNGYPQLIDWIDDFMAAAAAAKETK